jgi:anti-anti-sigma factor
MKQSSCTLESADSGESGTDQKVTDAAGEVVLHIIVRPREEPAGTVIAKLQDDLDLNVSDQLFIRLQEVMQGSVREMQGHAPVQHIILDMTDVVFLDSAGLSIVLEIRRRLVERGGTLRLFGASRQIIRVLQITQLEAYLLAHTTEAEALNAVRQQQSQ